MDFDLQIVALLTTVTILCVAVAYIDRKSFRIPNILNALIAMTGLYYSNLMNSELLHWTVLLMAGTFLLFWGFSVLALKLKGKTAFGMGDVKFIAAASPWLGAVLLPWMLFMAGLLAILFALLLHKGHWNSFKNRRIAFGPFLSFAILLDSRAASVAELEF